MGIASLVLGIIAVVLSFIPVINWIGIVVGVIGIVLGVVAKKNNPEDGQAKAGFITSIVGTSVAIIFTIACFACSSAVNKATNDQFQKSFEKSMKEMGPALKELQKAADEAKKQQNQ